MVFEVFEVFWGVFDDFGGVFGVVFGGFGRIVKTPDYGKRDWRIVKIV